MGEEWGIRAGGGERGRVGAGERREKKSREKESRKKESRARKRIRLVVGNRVEESQEES